jgi:murein DD-endopeptidase MepM/ murein hydrolase activator NlpD
LAKIREVKSEAGKVSCLNIFSLLTLSLLVFLTASIAGDDDPPRAYAEGEKPFRLPFMEPPGPHSWMLGQPYGNTIGAYFARNRSYVRVQGIHFGVDLSAPCGTTLVAIGDGIVQGTDGPWGSAPHNLMIDHPNGLSSLYGHLLERPNLAPGTPVKRGQPVAKVGDPAETCYAAPHVHLEIRSHSYLHFYNPIEFIEADWDSILLTASLGRVYERDLDNPRRWQSLTDQPEVDFRGPLLNDYARPWPAGVQR